MPHEYARNQARILGRWRDAGASKPRRLRPAAGLPTGWHDSVMVFTLQPVCCCRTPHSVVPQWGLFGTQHSRKPVFADALFA
jgi:hypothetical protein